LVWLTAGAARAKITTARITISGPSMTRTIEVTDLITLQKLGCGQALSSPKCEPVFELAGSNIREY
jgi:hypothetical protein